MKSEEMFDKVKQIIEGCGFNIPESHFLIGVSGGMDSMCLLDVLSRMPCRITVAHYNHQLRSDADKDKVLVGNISENLGISFVFGHGDVAEHAKENGLSLEEAARLLRYQFLFDSARQEKCNAVIVAHNADDQVETMMMHLLRGSGIAGLKGMKVFSYLSYFEKDIPILRPLLGVWREEIEKYQQLHSVKFCEDYTNQDTTFFRNRIRHELIPILTTYNPNFKLAAWRMGDNLRSDFSIIEALQQKDWEVCIINQQESFLVFSLDRIKALPESRVRNLLRTAMSTLRPEIRDFGFERMMSLIEFLQFPSESQTFELFSEFQCFIHEEKLFLGLEEKILQFFQKQYPQMGYTEKTVNQGELNIELNEFWSLSIELLEFEDRLWKEIKSSPDDEAWLDFSTLNWPLFLRPMVPGDRFSPFGMKEHQVKVSDYFINEGLPKKVRGRIPLLVSNEEIVWVVGKRISEKFRVTETTKELIHFCLKRKEK